MDDIVAVGKVPSRPVQMLTQTPLVMSLPGTDTLPGRAASTGGIYASSHFFDDIHLNLTWEMRKQIAMAMTDPIAVFDFVNEKPAVFTAGYKYLAERKMLYCN